MPTPEESARRQIVKQALRQQEREQVRASLPVSAQVMRSLFDFVEEELSRAECDNRLTHTLTFLAERGLQVDAVVRWLQDAGGFCDCEVLANAEERFLFAFPNEA